MTYGNGSVGFCACGQLALAHCLRCGKTLCEAHVRELPASPSGVSADTLGRFALAVRDTGGPHCVSCREQIGAYVLQQSHNAPRAPLPEHWLDRAIALKSDDSRNDEEKVGDAQLPHSLTVKDIVGEFLRRIAPRPPLESVPIGGRSRMSAPDYVEGWSVDCRRTECVAPGPAGGSYPLPCLISVHGELLGPNREDDGRQGVEWWVLEDSDIELSRLVSGVAQILVMSEFAYTPPA